MDHRKRIADLFSATKDEVTDLVLSDVLPEVVKDCGGVLLSEAVAQLAGEIVGAVFPRLNNIRLSYKQNRLERNVAVMLRMLAESDQALSDRVAHLEESVEGRQFIQQSRELMLDGIVDEIQESKVKYNVNGFINLLQTDDPNMDMALMFFKTLYELTDLDIRLLGSYDIRNILQDNRFDSYEEGFDSQQLRYVKEKLVRLGLLSSRNEALTDKNIEMIIEYLQKADKDAQSKRPKGVRLPRFKKLYSSDSYSITSLGRTLLQLISENCDLSDVDVPSDESDVDADIETILS